MNQKLLEEIGRTLYQKRIKKEYSLDKISEITKISIKNLEFLEQGIFHKLPGKFYEKSFIKIYAQALKLNTEKLINIYKEANKIVDETEENESKEITNIKKLHYFFSENRLPSVAFLSISLIVFSFIIIFQLFVPDKIKTNSPMKKETNNFQINDNIQNQSGDFIKEIENLKKETPIKNTNLNMDDIDYSSNLQNNNIYFKEILATEDVWLEIKDTDGSSMIATLLKKNETFSIPNEEGLTITLSNAGVVKIKNGDILSSEIGSFGTILNSVSLDSLLNKY